MFKMSIIRTLVCKRVPVHHGSLQLFLAKTDNLSTIQDQNDYLKLNYTTSSHPHTKLVNVRVFITIIKLNEVSIAINKLTCTCWQASITLTRPHFRRLRYLPSPPRPNYVEHVFSRSRSRVPVCTCVFSFPRVREWIISDIWAFPTFLWVDLTAWTKVMSVSFWWALLKPRCATRPEDEIEKRRSPWNVLLTWPPVPDHVTAQVIKLSAIILCTKYITWSNRSDYTA